jgi:hypothetical protein
MTVSLTGGIRNNRAGRRILVLHREQAYNLAIQRLIDKANGKTTKDEITPADVSNRNRKLNEARRGNKCL